MMSLYIQVLNAICHVSLRLCDSAFAVYIGLTICTVLRYVVVESNPGLICAFLRHEILFPTTLSRVPPPLKHKTTIWI